MATPVRAKGLSRSLVAWYRQNRRDFVWRTTADPYVILLSEIMLQQTQVARVQEMLPRFLKKFPTIQRLAAASAGDVLRAWRGMGYNNRAVRLHKLANIIQHKFDGRIPDSVEELLLLPGIGPYTARAVACFAFGARVEVVDVNVRRVLSRLSRRMRDAACLLPDRLVHRVATTWLPSDAYTWNQALMELGSTICTARSPGCVKCPLRNLCSSAQLGTGRSRTDRASVQHRPRIEPSHDGIPNRIWRGRVVKILTALPSGRTVTVSNLGKAVKPDYQSGEHEWLVAVSRGLERDGILEISGNGKRLRFRLPGP